MARLARAVAAGVPHHVTQRGNRRQATFFGDGDCALYRDLLAAWCGRHGVAVWAWCLMPNHVHLVLVPAEEAGLRQALGEAHRRYTQAVNRRQGWVGHLWQGRFASCALDLPHLLGAVRYVELNPVRARLVTAPESWPWSSATAHLTGSGDGLVTMGPPSEVVGDWRAFLDGGLPERQADALRQHERTGRPLGDAGFVAELEARLGRRLRPGSEVGGRRGLPRRRRRRVS
jgi:putative transposase